MPALTPRGDFAWRNTALDWRVVADPVELAGLSPDVRAAADDWWNRLTHEERVRQFETAPEAIRNLREQLRRDGYFGPLATERYLADRGYGEIQPLGLSAYLEAVRQFLVGYVAFPSPEAADTIAVWIAHAQLYEPFLDAGLDLFDTSPLLAFLSAEMRSGKTRALDCLALLVPRPERAIQPSEAWLYTVLSQRPRPTVLIDEIDTVFAKGNAEKHEGIRGVLNSGNRAGTPVTRVRLRANGARELERFAVDGPKALAGIGSLPDTVLDRSIVITMKRRTADEPVERFRQRQAERIASAIQLDVDAVLAQADAYEGIHDELRALSPADLDDRAADSWEALFVVALLAGGDWPTRAQQAALALAKGGELPASLGVRLLSDVRDVFGDEPYVLTHDLLARLHDLEDAPWGDWYGARISARKVADLLRPYRISPELRRWNGKVQRGYARGAFEDAWKRLLPSSSPLTVTSVTPATPRSAAPTVDEPATGHARDEPEDDGTGGTAVAVVAGVTATVDSDSVQVPMSVTHDPDRAVRAWVGTQPMTREFRDACWAIVKSTKDLHETGHGAAVRWARAALGLDDA